MLHSLEYLQATVEFAAHIRALTGKEHDMLDKSTAPLEVLGSPLNGEAYLSAADGSSVIMRVPAVRLVAINQCCGFALHVTSPCIIHTLEPDLGTQCTCRLLIPAPCKTCAKPKPIC